MSFLKASTSFSRFHVLDAIPKDFWGRVPEKLRRFAFMDIDDIAEERAFGWANFDDMLDTEWRLSPPEKAGYLTFSLRLETRRIPPAVLKKHTRLALRAEEERIRQEGKKFIPRERKKEIAEQVKLRLMSRFLPIPAEFQVIWNMSTQEVYFASTQTKMIEMFAEFFARCFELRLEQLLPCALALQLCGEEVSSRLDNVESTSFV